MEHLSNGSHQNDNLADVIWSYTIESASDVA